MTPKRKWQVWVELPENASAELIKQATDMAYITGHKIDGNWVILREGSRAACLKHYKMVKRFSNLEPHLGYSLD